MIACGFLDKEPQINADERRYKPVTKFIGLSVHQLFSVTESGKTIHRKGRKERKEKRLESLHHLRPALRKYSLSELGTRMTRIRRIFTDTIDPCASVSSVQSVFYGDCPHVAPSTKISGFIGVPQLFLGNRAKEECGVVANKEPQINADERRYILTTDYIKITHRKGRKERKVKRQESLRPLLHSMKKHRLSEPGTRMTRIRRIFTDTIDPCASVSSVQSVFCRSFSGMRPTCMKVSAFIGVHLRFLNGVIFRTGLTGLTGYVLFFNPVNPVILSNLKCQLPTLQWSQRWR